MSVHTCACHGGRDTDARAARLTVWAQGPSGPRSHGQGYLRAAAEGLAGQFRVGHGHRRPTAARRPRGRSCPVSPLSYSRTLPTVLAHGPQHTPPCMICCVQTIPLWVLGENRSGDSQHSRHQADGPRCASGGPGRVEGNRDRPRVAAASVDARRPSACPRPCSPRGEGSHGHWDPAPPCPGISSSTRGCSPTLGPLGVGAATT